HPISKRDWSSDVCSSDLFAKPCGPVRRNGTAQKDLLPGEAGADHPGRIAERPSTKRAPGRSRGLAVSLVTPPQPKPSLPQWLSRSEERRVGKECRSELAC